MTNPTNNKVVLGPASSSTAFFCSEVEGVLDHVTKDASGNVVLHLEGADPSRICGNRECNSANKNNPSKKCSRCKRISYCSKECQVSDWNRHKVEECIKKPVDRKVEKLDGIEDMNEFLCATVVAQMKTLNSRKEPNYSNKNDAWKRDMLKRFGPERRFSTKQDQSLDDLKSAFLMHYYVQIASFAALHISKYPRLKGALFLFSKVAMFDLGNLTDDYVKKFDRMFVLAWGYQDVNGETHHPKFSVLDLAGKFHHTVKSLPYLMKEACDEASFPLVFCCDPPGSLLPDEFDSILRPPRGVDNVEYIHETMQYTSSGPVRFIDFEALADVGMSLGEMDVYGLNIDRDSFEPVEFGIQNKGKIR